MIIKNITKHIISYALIIAVLLPFAVQFTHNIEHQHKHACLVSDLHIDSHEQDCSVFHFKVDQNSIFSPINFEPIQVHHFYKKIIKHEVQYVQTSFYKKASRAPPSLLL